MTQTELSDLSLGKFLEAIGKTAAQCLKIPPRITLSEWADTYRYIPSESGSINGRWRTSYAPYQKEMMDAISDPLSERVVIMCSAQIGKSELLLNTIGYYIHQEPCNIAVVQASGAAAQGFSKERFSPMVRVTPVLRDLVADNKSKETSSTVRTKQFVGGFLNFLSGSNPSELKVFVENGSQHSAPLSQGRRLPAPCCLRPMTMGFCKDYCSWGWRLAR